MNSFHVAFEKAYLHNLVEHPVTLTHVAGAGATGVSWRSNSEGENEDRPSALKGSRSGKIPRHPGGEKIRVHC